MKKFVLHISLFVLLLVGFMIGVFMNADGSSDPYYLKLTTPEKSNLILGTSKAAQGIQPQVLQSILDIDFYNYSFSFFASPYGRVYLESIKNKINKNGRNQTFVLTVDSWSLSSQKSIKNDTTKFREESSFLKDITNVTQNPNLKYLLKHADGSYYKILMKDATAFLNDDGWLEVSLNNNVDQVSRRTNHTISSYLKKAKNYEYSEVRNNYLVETIYYLKEYGSVYLVRLPIHPKVQEIENQLIPNFNDQINFAIEVSDGYLDLTNENALHTYTDGIHLDKKSSKEVSLTIASWIK